MVQGERQFQWENGQFPVSPHSLILGISFRPHMKDTSAIPTVLIELLNFLAHPVVASSSVPSLHGTGSGRDQTLALHPHFKSRTIKPRAFGVVFFDRDFASIQAELSQSSATELKSPLPLPKLEQQLHRPARRFPPCKIRAVPFYKLATTASHMLPAPVVVHRDLLLTQWCLDSQTN